MEADSDGPRTAVLDMRGFGCASCAHAIEHAGRKIPGVRDVQVRLGERVIEVTYDGNPAALARIRELVRKLGHEAVPREGNRTPGGAE